MGSRRGCASREEIARNAKSEASAHDFLKTDSIMQGNYEQESGALNRIIQKISFYRESCSESKL